MASFYPPVRTLMGPGPSDVSPRVAAALGRPTIGHLDPEFIRLMDELRDLIRYAYQTRNELTFAVSAPASAGMECCFVNLVEPGTKVVVAQNGVFGGRMKENVERAGGEAILVEDEWGKPVDPNKVEEALKARPDAAILAFVQAETSTGAQSDAAALARIGREHDCLVLVDTVTSLGGTPVKVDEWDFDAVYSGTQKCLSCTPGASPVTFSSRAVDIIRNRKTKVQSWFLDVNLLMGYWSGESKRAYHHTAPINVMYGLHEALTILQEEGLENTWARHRRNHEALREGLEAMGISFVVEESARLPQLNAVSVPLGVDEAAVRARLLRDYDLEIGAGLGAMAGKIWRIGLMGHSSSPRNVYRCLSALESVLCDMAAPIEKGVALEKARGVYEKAA